MKISKLIVFTILFSPINLIFGQTENTNFLKEYKAPYFKFQSLDVGFYTSGSGGFKSNSNSDFVLNSNLAYKLFLNTQKVQGINNTNVGALMYYTNLSEVSNLTYRFSLDNQLFKRSFINDKKLFIGYGNNLRISQINRVFKDSITLKSDGLNMNINPTVSIGKGRVEPIYYARKSWDIEKALLKSNTIDSELAINQRTVLADKIAVIQNRRFFDSRLNRIYQLEAVDSVLNEMGIVDEVNMKYYTRLTDAFLYSYNPNRLSGGQFEMGITQGFSIFETSDNSQNNSKNYNLNGFASYSYYLPMSYQIQHNFKASVLVGKSRTFYGSTSNNYSSDRFPISANLEYNLGYYPTTRTYLELATLVGFVNDDPYFGVGANYYHYFSPKLRLHGVAKLMLGGSNVVLTPSQYNQFLTTEIFNQLDGLSGPYEFNIGLNYAIF